MIPVNGRPMIQTVIENINVSGAHFIFIVQKTHNKLYGLQEFLQKVSPGCDVIEINGLTDGAACTVLAAENVINTSIPLLIANSDQYLEWDAEEFFKDSFFSDVDGMISTFVKDEPDNKWSYARLNTEGFVSEVQEKVPISSFASTGIYFWKRGSDFCRYAHQMIDKDIRSNKEFYVCPVYNEAIADGKRFKIKHCKRMWGIGVPDDLEYFLENQHMRLE